MQGLPFFLVILSAIAHGYWNFLFKQAHNKEAFLCLSKLLEPAIYALPFAYALHMWGMSVADLWYVAVGTLLAVANYICLAKSYQALDLTIAYPVSRSSTIFLPFLAFFLFQEYIDITGWLSVVFASLGVLVIPLDNFRLPHGNARPAVSVRGLVLALLAAFTVALYTLWGKEAVRHMHPFVYMYCYTLASNVYFIPLLRKLDHRAIRLEWRENKWRIAAVAVLNTLSFVLILFALSLGKVSYVGVLRQTSLVVGAGLGWMVLHERFAPPRVLGVALVIAGACLTYFAS